MDQAEKLRVLMKESLQRSSPKPQQDISIYTIASGKGGVGKTNVVVNLAIALQKRGKKVLIIDADLGMANADVVLGIFPKYTLYDVLFHNHPLEDALITGPQGIKVLPGGSGMMDMVNLDVERQEAMAKEFLTLEGIDTILIDTGAGISKNSLSFIAFSQELIIVTTPEPTSLTDAYGVIKILAKHKFKKSIKVIINRSVEVSQAKSTFEKLKRTADTFLQIQLENLGYILDDSHVSRSVMKQMPFIMQYPHCIASKCMNGIADQFIGQKSTKGKIRSIQEVYHRLIKVFG